MTRKTNRTNISTPSAVAAAAVVAGLMLVSVALAFGHSARSFTSM